jgi:hypothetical protein
MVSSLFNERPVPRKVPCIIHPPPPPDPIQPPGTRPPALSGMAHWRDLYAPEFWEAFQFVDLISVDGGFSYQGWTSFKTGYIGLRILSAPGSNLWQVTLFTSWNGIAEGSHTWNNVYVDPDKPFDTGLLTYEQPPSPPDLFLLVARVVL